MVLRGVGKTFKKRAGRKKSFLFKKKLGLFVASSGGGKILGWVFFDMHAFVPRLASDCWILGRVRLWMNQCTGMSQAWQWVHGNAVHGRLFSEGLAQFTIMSKICLCGGDEEVCPSLSVVPVEELCNQQCSGLFLAMLVSVRLSVVRKGPRSALACRV